MAHAAQVEALEKQLLNAASLVEEQVDSQLQKLDNLEENELEKIRSQRMEQMKKLAKQKQDWISAGHGTLTELANEPEFFEAAKKSSKMVCNFFDSATVASTVMTERLRELTRKYISVRFVTLNKEKCKFLIDRLNIRVFPTLAVVKNGQTGDYIRAPPEAIADDHGDNLDKTLSLAWVEWRIAQTGIIPYDGDLKNPPSLAKMPQPRGKSILGVPPKSVGIRGTKAKEDDGSSDDDW